MRHGLSASLDLALFVRQSNCRTGRPKYGVLKVREKLKKNSAAPSTVEAVFWACRDGAPPPVPMVSLERSYVREVLASPFCGGWGWGRIATPARNVPGGLVVGYSGRA